MKKLLLFFAAMLVAGSMWGDPTTIYSETFGNNNSGSNKSWSDATNYFSDENTADWAATTSWKVGKNTSSPCEVVGSSGNSGIFSPNTANTDITFTFGDLSGYQNVVFSCNFQNNATTKGDRTITIKASADGGSTWSNDLIGSNKSQAWQTFSYEVPSEYLNNFAIKITNTSTNTSRLDDIKLIGDDASDNRTATSLNWSSNEQTVRIGTTYSLPTLTTNPSSLTNVKYSSSVSSVASINENTGVITLNSAGTTIITASFEGDDTYKPSTASYTLIVKAVGVSEVWEKVTSAPTSWEGEYLFIAKAGDEGGYYVFNGLGTNGDSFMQAIELSEDETTVEANTITTSFSSAEKPSLTVTSTSTSGQYYIKGATQYLGGSTGGASLTTNQSAWVFQIQDNGNIWIRVYGSTMTRTLMLQETSAGVHYFKHYATSSTNGYYPVLVYRKRTAAPAEETSSLKFVATNGNGKYYATFSSEHAIKFDETFINDEETCMATIKAYAVYAIDGELVLTDLNTAYNDGNYTYIPANTGVLFEYTLDEDSEKFDATVPFEYADEAADYLDAVGDNMLHPASVTLTGNYTYYKLAYDTYDASAGTGTGLGFYYGAEGGAAFTGKAGTAYLAVPKSTSGNAPRRYLLDQTGTATAVEDVETTEEVVKFVENGLLLIKKNGVVYNAMGQIVR